MKTLHPEPLTAAAFAPFGEVIAAAAATRHYAINGGNTERYHDLARLVSTIGTRAPSTTPASTASARYSSCLATMLPDSRSGTTRMSA